MKSINKKISDKTIILKINSIMNNQKKGHQNLSQDDIENLLIIKFLLKCYIDNKTSVIIDFQTTPEIDDEKSKIILDELSLNQIISNPSWALGGCWFKIINSIRFRDYLYKEIEIIIKKNT